MAYDILSVRTSDRTAANKAAPLTGATANGVKFNNATNKVQVFYLNDSGGAVVLRVKNAPTIESKVDDMAVTDKSTVSIANGEAAVLGPWDNNFYGNNDPDDDGLPAGKTILIEYASGDAGKFVASVLGT